MFYGCNIFSLFSEDINYALFWSSHLLPVLFCIFFFWVLFCLFDPCFYLILGVFLKCLVIFWLFMFKYESLKCYWKLCVPPWGLIDWYTSSWVDTTWLLPFHCETPISRIRRSFLFFSATSLLQREHFQFPSCWYINLVVCVLGSK